jgi:DNA-binding NarL/FixJ family response regulator
MARVLALVPDLLFGSRVQGSLQAAGHDVELISDAALLRSRLSDADAPAAAVLLVDLTDRDADGAQTVEELRSAGALDGVRTLAFYSHVETATRRRAEQAGFERVVPRSRMAREGPELVAGLLSG